MAPHLFGDFYPLTNYSTAGNVWMAFQFDCPERGEGSVQAFRRSGSEEPKRTLRLMGLDRAARYEVFDVDAATPRQVGGEDLLERGISIEIAGKPGAAIIAYRKL